jgi:DNA replicative helicase MCM subunit Mcm2 (Cdc46/Mcm family)
MAEADETLEAFTGEDFGLPDDELDEKFAALVESEDMLDYWAARINPKVVGMEDEKRAVMLSIASHGDKFGDRGRIHVLMYGDPGTAKTAIGSFLVFELGATGASMRSSRVGLTADASGNEITLGALPRANDGVIFIDELEKFDQHSLQGLLEALEEGRIQIDVGKTHTVIDARVRCIACANDISKKLSRELIDRFDFKFEILKPDLEFKKKIMRSRVMHWFREKAGHDGLNLKNYLRWIRNYEPHISDGVRKSWMKLIEMYLVLTESEGSIREDESMIRIAVTISKMHHRDAIPDDMVRAIRIRHPDLNGLIE